MPQETEALRFMRVLWQVAHSLDVRSKWMARNLGITGPQRLVLRVVGRTPDIGASAIATTLEMHASTLTGIVARLERKGYLSRIPDPTDGRRSRFRLTARGRRLDQERVGTVEAAVSRAVARSSQEERTYTELLLGRVVQELDRSETPAVAARRRRA